MYKRIIAFLVSMALFLGMVLSMEAYAKTSATDASVNTTYTVKLSSATDKKMYKFKTPEAGRISIDVATTAQGDNYAITTTLEDETGKIVVDPESGSAYTMASYGAAAGQIFYLIVTDSYRGYDTSFKITIGFSADTGWETENNDTSEDADAITAGQKYYGSISRSSDIDFFKFRLSAAKKIKLYFGPNVIDGRQRQWDVDIYNEAGDQVDVFDTASKSSMTLKLKKGLYYIRVSGGTSVADDGTIAAGVGGDYWLQLSVSKLSVKKPAITSVKIKGTASWLYDNYATATITIKNAGSNIDGFTFRISKSRSMKSGTKKKNYSLSSDGVTAKKIRSAVRMGIYPAYYVQVRGYVRDAFGGKIYGKYSSVKSGKLSAKDYNKLK